jgi:HK97 family phage prohead protease
MKLNMLLTITSADSESRTITGRVVTWNETGSTSAGLTTFKPESIATKNVKLLLEHDRTRPIGKVLSMTATEQGIDATFKIAETTAGNDALIEAATGLRDGFSVGVKVNAHDFVDGVLVVAKGSLDEVSLVSEPAIDSARVSSVAASQDGEEYDEDDEEEMKATDENSDSVDEETEETNPTTEGDEVSDTTETVATAETVEASKHVPMAYTAPRSPIVDKVSYLQYSLKASVLHDEDARQYVKAADNTTSTAPGMVPTPQSRTVINALANADRGMIDAISREALTATGMTFELPKVTAVPLVSDIAENTTVTESSLSATYISVPVNSFKGRAISTIELIDRSDPSYLQALLQNLEFAYAKVTDEFVTAGIETVATSTPQAANDAEGFLGYTSAATAAVYGASLGFARSLVVSPKQWGNIMGYNDNGAPLYNAAQPSNAAGNVRGDSLRGVVSPGLNLFVSRSIGVAGTTTDDGDSSMVVINPDSFTWYESPRFELRTNINSDGTIDILYYGYGALAAKVPNGAHWNALP